MNPLKTTNKKKHMKQTIIISAVTTLVILVIAVQYNKSQVKKGKKSLFA